jgi:membrane protease YdiL (CAAX protease family)
MALLYGLTGSLWAPMVAHAVMDIVSGRIAFAASRENGSDRSAPELAA